MERDGGAPRGPSGLTGTLARPIMLASTFCRLAVAPRIVSVRIRLLLVRFDPERIKDALMQRCLQDIRGCIDRLPRHGLMLSTGNRCSKERQVTRRLSKWRDGRPRRRREAGFWSDKREKMVGPEGLSKANKFNDLNAGGAKSSRHENQQLAMSAVPHFWGDFDASFSVLADPRRRA